MKVAKLCSVVLGGLLAALPSAAFAQPAKAPLIKPRPGGADFIRMLGPHASATLAPASGQVGALVELPRGTTAQALGLDEVAPGIGRLRASPERVTAFADAHPELHLEVAPPLRILVDRAAQIVGLPLARLLYSQAGKTNVDGQGVIVGIADTGLDVSHPDFLDDGAIKRVAWLLDLSLKPVGLHPELEQKFGIRDANGALVAGAVLNADDMQLLYARGQKLPDDEVGHGTHVASLAAGGGGGGAYKGMARAATLVIARLTRSTGESIENDDLLRGAQFIFDRADFMKMPAVANLSLGSDFGPHDGSMLWERTLASYVGPDKPGRVIVAAAGNSGSIVTAPSHQTVRVTPGAQVRVPIETNGATKGGVQVWVNLRPTKGAMAIGLDGPDETWISPVDEGTKRGRNQGGYNAGVIFGSNVEGSPVQAGSRGAVVLWSGSWPRGRYHVTLEGDGFADLYLQATGDAALRPAAFLGGVREGTVNLPAAHPAILAVGCTASRPKWTSIAKQPSGLLVPVLDEAGGYFGGATRELEEGEVCWFSSAGPNADGVPKPQIAAPGAAIIGAMSRQAVPGNASSIFSTSNCPPIPGTENRDPRCLQVDKGHGVSVGTSMSSPIVAGAVALLLERDPTLTQDGVTALLQAGAHRIRGAALFDDQAGPGELDVAGSIAVMEQLKDKRAALPSPDASWITLSSSYAAADGSRPITAIVELRADRSTTERPDLFELARLRAEVLFDGKLLEDAPTMRRHGPGVFSYSYTPPPGSGGSVLTFAATFDGGRVVAPKVIPIATDPWTARYPVRAEGGCATSGTAETRGGGPFVWALALAALGVGRRRRRGAL